MIREWVIAFSFYDSRRVGRQTGKTSSYRLRYSRTTRRALSDMSASSASVSTYFSSQAKSASDRQHWKP
jgi:hypothetical protein